jgi:hypothetical protein
MEVAAPVATLPATIDELVVLVLPAPLALDDEERTTPLSASLNTLNLSKSDTTEEPKSVILRVRHIWSIFMDEDEDMLLWGLIEAGCWVAVWLLPIATPLETAFDEDADEAATMAINCADLAAFAKGFALNSEPWHVGEESEVSVLVLLWQLDEETEQDDPLKLWLIFVLRDFWVLFLFAKAAEVSSPLIVNFSCKCNAHE